MIVTSYLFPSGRFSNDRLLALTAALDHDASKLVIDLSCRRVGVEHGEDKWVVAMDKWQTLTDMELSKGKL